ncbi:MAG: hypothetical protein IPK03_06885 [Bacteroidetes bacterium]|nr:hypothetical protein [Bacteroidota bacterium]
MHQWLASNGTYSFTCSVPGEYSFMVPVCEPSPSTQLHEYTINHYGIGSNG